MKTIPITRIEFKNINLIFLVLLYDEKRNVFFEDRTKLKKPSEIITSLLGIKIKTLKPKNFLTC